MASRNSSPFVLAGAFMVLFALGVGAMTVGAPLAPVVLVVAGIGGALLLKATGERKFDKAEALEPGALDQYPLRFPAERWSVGSPFQFRLLPSTRRAWAPGVLGIGFDAVRFVPSSPAKTHLAWSGRPTSVEVIKMMQVCSVRFHTSDGAAQFSIQQPAGTVRAQLAPMLPVKNG